jgi:hypothetical protein
MNRHNEHHDAHVLLCCGSSGPQPQVQCPASYLLYTLVTPAMASWEVVR